MRKTTPSICSHPACNARPVHTVGSKTGKAQCEQMFSALP
jgi:hypothetical protein